MYTVLEKSKIRKRAEYFKQACGFKSIVSAIRAAISETKIFDALAQNPMTFLTYKKLDNTIQHAMVTTKKDYIPKIDHVKGTGGGYTYFQVRFYDTVKMGWRSCRLERLIAIHW